MAPASIDPTMEFFQKLTTADSIAQVELALSNFAGWAGGRLVFTPIGGRQNNRGIIEVATDPGRCLIERVTNGGDAILELEHLLHKGVPICISPREAGQSWLHIPAQGLSQLSTVERRELAKRLVITIEEGEGKHSRVVTVRDQGIGLTPDELPNTILSLNESNKISKRYLAGTYGQGGSSTFAVSRYSVIASKKKGADRIALTLVKYLDLPAETHKTGHYVYAILDDAVIGIPADDVNFEVGTFVRHIGYDLTNYSGSFDPGSVYGLLNRYLFDPVISVTLQNRVHGWNRTIKGSRNSLNGAVDDGDDAKGAGIAHSVPLHSVSLGDLGSIGIEYWLLEHSDTNKNPIRAYVDHNKPFILTNNGQNQGEVTQRLLKKDIEFPYLAGRFICHVNCDSLTADAKRRFFTSTREQTREGFVYEKIVEQVVSSIRADDELKLANAAAKERSLKNQDVASEKQIKSEVSRLLKLHGLSMDQGESHSAAEKGVGKTAVAGATGAEQAKRTSGGGGGGGKPNPIEITEPPDFVRVMGPESEPITFHKGQRRYVRVETNANSDYHDANDLNLSKFNVILGPQLKLAGTTPLKGGRMRLIVDCLDTAGIGETGEIKVELSRKGLSVLTDAHSFAIVEPPKAKPKPSSPNFPNFKVIPVSGVADENWARFPDGVKSSEVASAAIMSDGTLHIYYAETQPKFAEEMKRLEAKDVAKAKTFRNRYEIWLAVHSLLLYQDQENAEPSAWDELREEDQQVIEQHERMRIGILSALMAQREVALGSGAGGEDE